MPKVSAIIVNHNAASYVESCLRSLEAEFERSLRPKGYTGEAIVVDTCSSAEDRARLEAIAKGGVPVVFLPENAGYAGGLNAGLERATGETLLLLNPDVLALEGSVLALVEFLAEHRDVGAANPRLWLDPERSFLHPPIPSPSISRLLADKVASFGGGAYRLVSRKRTVDLLRYWERRQPVEVDSLSGAFLATRRDVIERVGPFDASYALYYEDADWCRRVRRAGQRLVLVPAAEAVHFYSVSSNQDFAAAMSRHDAARRRYFDKFYGPLGGVLAAAEAKRSALPAEHPAVRTLAAAEDLGACTEPPYFALPESNSRYLCQMAGDPAFSLSVGGFPSGERFSLSSTVWKHMRPGEYFVRIVSLPGKNVVKTWKLRRAEAPAANAPVAAPAAASSAPSPSPAPAAAAAPAAAPADVPRTTSALPLFGNEPAPAAAVAPESAEREEPVIAPYQKADEFRILELWKKVFGKDGKERKLAAWHYRFLANPIGMHVMLAKGAATGRVLAQFAGVPVRVFVRGEQHVFAQMVDSMADPDYRQGLRKPGLFTRVVTAYVEKWGQPGQESLGFGLPNPQAYRIGKRTQGYEDLRDLEWRAKPLTSPPGPAPDAVPKLSIQSPRAPGKRLEELWGKVKSQHDVWVIRDHLYLDWRYWKNPDVNYRYLVAILANEVVGLAVGVERFLGEETFAIADFIVVDGEDQVARHLLAACEDAARKAGCQKIVGSFTPAGCREDGLLAEAGYSLEKAPWKWVGRIYAKEKLAWDDLQKNWFLTLGDSDLV